MRIGDLGLLFVYDKNMRSVEKRPETEFTPIRNRLQLVACGLVLFLVGAAKISRGVQVSTHWTGQSLFSWGLIAGGSVCILLSLIPMSWITKASENPRAKHRSHH
jgi:hypothetical protein